MEFPDSPIKGSLPQKNPKPPSPKSRPVQLETADAELSCPAEPWMSTLEVARGTRFHDMYIFHIIHNIRLYFIGIHGWHASWIDHVRHEILMSSSFPHHASTYISCHLCRSKLALLGLSRSACCCRLCLVNSWQIQLALQKTYSFALTISQLYTIITLFMFITFFCAIKCIWCKSSLNYCRKACGIYNPTSFLQTCPAGIRPLAHLNDVWPIRVLREKAHKHMVQMR